VVFDITIKLAIGPALSYLQKKKKEEEEKKKTSKFQVVQKLQGVC
jgi:hypothetical protein